FGNLLVVGERRTDEADAQGHALARLALRHFLLQLLGRAVADGAVRVAGEAEAASLPAAARPLRQEQAGELAIGGDDLRGGGIEVQIARHPAADRQRRILARYHLAQPAVVAVDRLVERRHVNSLNRGEGAPQRRLVAPAAGLQLLADRRDQ